MNSEEMRRKEPPVSMLYPRETKTREVRLLDGIWRFLKSSYNKPEEGLDGKWYEKGLDNLGLKTIPMPVPSSYNDITTDKDLRDHLGAVWYERTFFVPETWKEKRIVWLRFGGVVNDLRVEVKEYFNTYSNYEKVGNYPSIRDITNQLDFKSENRITVFCSNELKSKTVPQGNYVSIHGKVVPDHKFNYFLYAGIHRSVHLYTTPFAYVRDIQSKIRELKDGNATIDCEIEVENVRKSRVELILYKKDGAEVFRKTNITIENICVSTKLEVSNVTPWWPYLMHEEPGYLYTLECHLFDEKSNLIDVYRMPYGIRKLSWNDKGMFINDKPIYLQGVNKHEDSDIRGRGYDLALVTHDFNLLKWLGANVYQTNIYPHSDEAMQLADELGIMIIAECSSAHLSTYDKSYLEVHKNAMRMLVRRDREHPSVIAWSLGHLMNSHHNAAKEYFENLINFVKYFDGTRPFTGSFLHHIDDYMVESLDVVEWVHYYGWEADFGYTDWIKNQVVESMKTLIKKHRKPIMMVGYGASALEGYHGLPPAPWTEEYQSELMHEYFKAFETLRRDSPLFIGELIHNFADYKGKMDMKYSVGTRIGIFTRQRQPKSAAGVLRKRYFVLANKLYNYSLPQDLFQYVVG